MSMNRKKKATEAEAVGFSTDVPGKIGLVFSKVFGGSGGRMIGLVMSLYP